MPGAASLAVGEYYAHPRNQFWDIMGNLFGAGRHLDYRDRLPVLVQRGVALWDVIASCERHGSLDANIVASSIKVHSIEQLLDACPSLSCIYFNGRTAESCFNKQVRPNVSKRQIDRLRFFTLPSTSPANASMTLPEKIERWKRMVHDMA